MPVVEVPAAKSSHDSMFRSVPVASESASVAPSGLLSRSRKVSPLSSTVSSMTVTDTVFSVSPGAKVSVPCTAS